MRQFVCNCIVAFFLLSIPVSGFAQDQVNSTNGGPRVSADNDETALVAEGNGPRLVESNNQNSSSGSPRVNAKGKTFAPDGTETGTFEGFVDYRTQASAPSGGKRKGGGGGASASSYIKSLDARLQTLTETIANKSAFTAEERAELDTLKQNYADLMKAGILTKADFETRMTTLDQIVSALKRIEDKIDAGNTPWYQDWTKWAVIVGFLLLFLLTIALVVGLYFWIGRRGDGNDVAGTVRTVIREELVEHRSSSTVETPGHAANPAVGHVTPSGCRVSETFEANVLESLESLRGRVDGIDSALNAHVDYHREEMEPRLAGAIDNLTTRVNDNTTAVDGVRQVQGRHGETLAETNRLLAEMRDALNANAIPRPAGNYDGYSAILRVEPDILPTSGGRVRIFGADDFEFEAGKEFYIGKKELFLVNDYEVVGPHEVDARIPDHPPTIKPETGRPIRAHLTYYDNEKDIRAVLRRAIMFRDEEPATATSDDDAA